MAQSFFEIEQGLELNSSVFLSGAGAPGGSSPEDNVGKGSFYLDTTNGALYIKDTAGSGTDKWKEMSTQAYVDTAVTTGIFWRQPVDAHEDTDTAVPISTVNTIDGETIVDEMRVLFSALTSSTDRNVWIASGSTSDWTWTEDVNDEDAGDSVYVIAGSHAGHTYVYNGTDWVHTDVTSEDELGYIRTFVGKTGAGSETPTYSSTNYVTTGNSLEAAIGDLDAQAAQNATDIGNNDTDISTLQGEDGFIRTFVGKTGAGSETPTYSSTNYVTTTESLETAIGDLDTQAKVTADLLDSARAEITSNGITTVTTVDSVNVDTVSACKWIVYAQGTAEADSDKKYMAEVLAAHDGHTTGAGDDATDADFNEYGKIKMGSITGFDIAVDVSGTAGSQVMNLKITSTMSCDVRVIREVINI